MGSVKFVGTIHSIFKAESIKGKEDSFKVQKFWLNTEVETKYPQIIEFTLLGKNVGMFDELPRGTYVEIEVNVKGRVAKNNKVYNMLECWKITRQETIVAKKVETPKNDISNVTLANDAEMQDDLPF